MENLQNLGDIATWFSGIITLGLFIIGYVQIRQERIARKKNEENLLINKKREQAEQISCWVETNEYDHVWIAVSNQSRLPVYQSIFRWSSIKNEYKETCQVFEYEAFIIMVPPGIGYIDGQTMWSSNIVIEFAFRDAAGNNWVRKFDGTLTEIQELPLNYYSPNIAVRWHLLSKTKLF